MAKDTLGSLTLVAISGAIGIVGFELARQGDFGPNLQALAQQLDKSLTGVSITGGGTTTVSATDIATWAKNVGVPTWVGTLYVQDNKALPTSIATLNSWGDAKGYHKGTAWIAPPGVS